MPDEIDPEYVPEDPILTKLQEVYDELILQKAILNDIKTNTGT